MTKSKTVSEHDLILDSIKKTLKGVELNIKKQMSNLYADPNYKDLSNKRTDKGIINGKMPFRLGSIILVVFVFQKKKSSFTISLVTHIILT